jgi:hypothetical protein
VKTDELVSLLATGTEAVDMRLATRRFLVAVLGGTAIATLLTSAWLGLRPTLVRDLTVPMFWVKESFCAALGVAGLVAAFRAGRPGARLGWVWAASVATPVIVLWLLAAVALLVADPGNRTELIFGHTANVCSVCIALISTPLFVGVFAAMRAFAPTRLRLAGAAGGFAAGSVGALVYSLHCPELAAPFLGLWYVLGILIPTVVGAGVGAHVLRW